MSIVLIQGNSLHLPLADASVQMICCSPPYFKLRSYLAADDPLKAYELGAESVHDCLAWARGELPCALPCFLCQLRRVFAECLRVLRKDGVLFVVIGDSFWGGGGGNYGKESKSVKGRDGVHLTNVKNRRPPPGLKPKDLCGIPQRLALALQSDGWYWRQEIIWYKLNPMPESIADRCTKAHEQVLLFSKSSQYFWDGEAIKESTVTSVRLREKGNGESAVDTKMRGYGNYCGTYATGRNARSVWPLASESFAGAHFAVMPSTLAERCIRAGTPEAGCCPQCRIPYQRQRERTAIPDPTAKGSRFDVGKTGVNGHGRVQAGTRYLSQSLGFVPGCSCIAVALEAGCPDASHMNWLTTPVPSIVLDPFSGSGTTVFTARALGRHGIGIDLSWPYLLLSRERLGLTALEAWTHGQPVPRESFQDLPLFAGQEMAS